MNKQTSKTDSESHHKELESDHEDLKVYYFLRSLKRYSFIKTFLSFFSLQAIFAKYNLQSTEALRREIINWKVHDL